MARRVPEAARAAAQHAAVGWRPLPLRDGASQRPTDTLGNAVLVGETENCLTNCTRVGVSEALNREDTGKIGRSLWCENLPQTTGPARSEWRLMWWRVHIEQMQRVVCESLAEEQTTLSVLVPLENFVETCGADASEF